MNDLQHYIDERKKTDKGFVFHYDNGYEEFKIGALIREARQKSGLTQEELAKRLNTTKGAISRIENHAEDLKLSTLKKVAEALGKRLTIGMK